MVVYSDAVLEEFGTFVSGDEARDVSNATMLVGAIRTIAELCEISAKGFKIEIEDNRKAFEMYSLVCEHLKDCIEYQKNGLFGRMPPMDDLKKLDKFAAYIYPQARWHFVGETETTSKLMSFLSRSRTGRKTEEQVNFWMKNFCSRMKQLDKIRNQNLLDIDKDGFFEGIFDRYE